MNEENMSYISNGVLLSNKEWNYDIFRKMGGTRDHHVKQSKSVSEGQKSYFLSYEKSRPKIYKDINIFMYTCI
jgi:hypothetical protein